MFLAILALTTVALIVVLGLGILPLRSKNPKIALAFEGLSHGGVIVLLLIGSCHVVPLVSVILTEFGVDRPSLTAIWGTIGKAFAAKPIRVSRWLVLLLSADVAIFWTLYQGQETKKLAKWFSGFVTVLLGAMAVSFLLALVLPYFRLITALS